jgi:hypothetical protein
MSELLRAALSADEDTPAVVDVAAVRARAGRLRRTRYAAAGAAVITALAVLVPIAVPRPGRPAPAVAAPPALTCPDHLPGGPADGSGPGDLLPPGPVTGALVCRYADTPARFSGGRLTGTARLGPAEAGPLATRLAASPLRSDQVCSAELSTTFALVFAGPGWTATLRVETYGCALVSNGRVTRVSGVANAALKELEKRATR